MPRWSLCGLKAGERGQLIITIRIRNLPQRKELQVKDVFLSHPRGTVIMALAFN